MAAGFRPRLVNDAFGDPALFVPFVSRRRALLFDLGDLSALAPRDLLKISHIFVSHTHMDHFVGFDGLIRRLLGRNRTLHLYGPDGFRDNVAGKLSGYTWNLTDRYAESLNLVVHEVNSDRVRRTEFRCRDRFRAKESEEPTESPSFSDDLLVEPGLTVRAARLDHGIPCLGFSLSERFHIHVLPTALKDLGLKPGPWLSELKAALYREDPPDTTITARDGEGEATAFPLGWLADRITRRSRGQRVAYVTDVADTPENQKKILSLAENADHLFIEAAFREADRDQARAKHHLTARRAGWLAGRAGAARHTVFHFSPRYEGEEAALRAEARAGWEAGWREREANE
ncbi:MAG: ribonuclease Z [Desulfococcaceae bacterium]